MSWGTAAPAGAAAAGSGKIAFIDPVCTLNGCDFDIFTMNADGTGRRDLTRSPQHEENPAWSPDGRRIAFYKAGLSEDLWIVTPGGTHARWLTRDGGTEYQPTWSMDGARIAFTGSLRDQEDIWVVNSDGTGEMDLTADPAGNEYAPAWSPDGGTITFVAQPLGSQTFSIDLMDPDGSNRRTILSGLDPVAGLDWSPDGTRLVFSEASEPLTNQYDLYTMNADGTGLADVTDTPDSSELQPSWSPDGALIAFFDTLLPAGIWTISPDGTGLTFIGPGSQPDWQPLPQP